MKLYPLNALVIRISKPEKILKGLSTNTLEASKNAFVDLYGRIIVTFDQVKLANGDLLVILQETFYDSLYNHLEKFLKLTRTKLEKEPYHVYFDMDGMYPPDADEFSIPQKRGQLILTKKLLSTIVSEEEFTLFRVKNNIPLHGRDYTHDMLLNISDEFVSFIKGCFLGQEVLARVHNLSQPPKKLIVAYADECPEAERKQMTSKITDPETGRVMGFVFVENS